MPQANLNQEEITKRDEQHLSIIAASAGVGAVLTALAGCGYGLYVSIEYLIPALESAKLPYAAAVGITVGIDVFGIALVGTCSALPGALLGFGLGACGVASNSMFKCHKQPSPYNQPQQAEDDGADVELTMV